MRFVKLALSLAFFVPVFIVFGAAGRGDWYGVVVGAGIGVFFGCVFGGNPDWKIWDYIYGPKDPDAKDD